MVTIKDVARAAGVSASTVSHTLSGKRKISSETRARVLEAIKELGYRPNPVAKSLKTKRTDNIALSVQWGVMPGGSFFKLLLEGIVGEVSEANGFRVVITSHPKKSTISGGDQLSFSAEPVDGVILKDPGLEDGVLDELIQHGIPYAVLGRPGNPEITHFVDNDNIEVARIALKHLAELGHKRVLYLSGPPDLTVSADRLRGYTESVKELGLEEDQRLIVHSDFTQQRAYEEVYSLLNRGIAATAVWAANDLMAIGAIKAIRDFGYKIPDDISVVGVNNDLVADVCYPGLTTVDVNAKQLGVSVGRIILEQILTGESPSAPLIVPSELVVRESTSPARQP